MKSVAKALMDRIVIPAVRYVVNEVDPPIHRNTLIDELNKRVSSQCADYVMQHMERSLFHAKRELLWDHAIASRTTEGLFVEFGVHNGTSINYIAKRIAPQVIYGFDSFEGLDADWTGAGIPKGTFDRGGIPPTVDKNVKLIKGWFHDTLPNFMAQNGAPISFAHIDCDTYEATKVVLDNIKSTIPPGSVVVFDDYFGYRGWKIGGYKAWQEIVKEQELSYQYLGFGIHGVSVLITDPA
jgi:hypothetical protein